MEGSTLLAMLLRKELCSIPIAHWGYFFPCHVAVWRFIEAARPGAIGGLDAGYDSEPYFKGRGSDWFCEMLGNDEGYLTLLENIMYPLVDALTSEIIERGFLTDTEASGIDENMVRHLEELVLCRVDEAIAQGKLIRER